MAVTDQKIRVEQLAAAQLTVYTAPSGTTSSSKITSFTAHANGGRDVLNVHLVNSGDTAVAGNRVFSRAIPDGDTASIPIVNQVLKDGDFIVVSAESGSVLNIVGSVRETT